MTRVLIAGAGIGGLTAALALSRVGVASTVIERTAVLSEVGAGLQLSPNACRVLARYGLLDAVSAQATQPAAIRVRSGRTAHDLSILPLEDAAVRWGAPYLVIHRAALQRVLVDAVLADPSIELRLDTSLAGFGAASAGVSATVKHGRMARTLSADALIGADGVRSAVRARLAEGCADLPRETGRIAWRTMVPAANADPLFARPETGLWLGRDAHLVHYPLQGGRVVNVVAIMQGSAPTTDEDWAGSGDRRVIERRFIHWHPSVRRLIAEAESWTTWPLFDRAPLAAWNAGPIALLGDAAHPILPFFAQGAAQAIEDADALARSVAATRCLPDALSAYSRTRQPRVTRVQETARRLGRIYHLAGPAALARNATMHALGSHRLLARYDWLFGG